MHALLYSTLMTLFPASAPAVATIAQVAWLRGCWEFAAGQRTVEEHWTAARGRTMLGTGRTLRGDSVVEYEFILLREQGGKLAYEAHPSGQETATFTAAAATDTSVTFENPAHDFPQRVGYRRIGADSLVGWIEGMADGQTRKIEFPYRRMSCAGGA